MNKLNCVAQLKDKKELRKGALDLIFRKRKYPSQRQQKKPIGFSPMGFLRLILNWLFSQFISDTVDGNFNTFNGNVNLVFATDIGDGSFIKLVQ